MQDWKKGALIALAGVVILSFDSLLVRLIDASAWDLLFWRGALLSLTLLAVNIARKPAAPGPVIPRSPLVYLGGTAFAMSMVFFVLSVDNTQVASTLVIINTAPFFAAILALLFLREKLPLQTVIAIAVATGGIWLIFEYAPSAGEIRGDLYAFVAAQTGLILLLEILLGPMFVYLALGEQPSSNDIQGGLLILLTLVGHTLWEAFQGAKEGVTEDI